MTELTITIFIRGDNIDENHVAKCLSVKRWRALKKGDVISKALKTFASTDVWSCVVVDKKKNLKISQKNLRDVQKIFMGIKANKINESFSIEARIFFQSELAQGYFHLPVGVLAAFVDGGIPLSISVLSWGGVED